jgi:hypothetical protein
VRITEKGVEGNHEASNRESPDNYVIA